MNLQNFLEILNFRYTKVIWLKFARHYRLRSEQSSQTSHNAKQYLVMQTP
jgi:hypothetical protein